MTSRERKRFVLMQHEHKEYAIVARVLSYNKTTKLLKLEWPFSRMYPDDCVATPRGVKDAVVYRTRTEQIRFYETRQKALSAFRGIKRRYQQTLPRALMAHARACADWDRDFGDRPIVKSAPGAIDAYPSSDPHEKISLPPIPS